MKSCAACLLLALPLCGCRNFWRPPAPEPAIATTSGDREAILAVVTRETPIQNVRSLNFREGGTHAVVGLWGRPKGRHQLPDASPTGESVIELDKINGQWFVMQVNGQGL